jgi:DNA-binding protein H-NS
MKSAVQVIALIAICRKSKHGSANRKHLANGNAKMAKPSSFEAMSYAELAEMEVRIARMKIEKQNAERGELRQRIVAMVKEHGFELDEIIGKGRKGQGSVAIKYRDPQNAENTWTGRGRMPRWMTAAMKGSKMKKEDFLV